MDPPNKKQKVADESVEEEWNFENFQLERILLNDTKAKRVCVLGKCVQ